MGHDGSLCIIDSLSRSGPKLLALSPAAAAFSVWLERSEARPDVVRERRDELKIACQACVVISQHLRAKVSGG
jgi:hypothetical protein